jgi:hypothetical protein
MKASDLPVRVINLSGDQERILLDGPQHELEIVQRGSVVELRVSRGEVRLCVAEKLSLSAKTIELQSEGELSLKAGGDLLLEARGETRVTARNIDVSAVLGDVRIDANDDVRLEGERIRMNS